MHEPTALAEVEVSICVGDGSGTGTGPSSGPPDVSTARQIQTKWKTDIVSVTHVDFPVKQDHPAMMVLHLIAALVINLSHCSAASRDLQQSRSSVVVRSLPSDRTQK